MKGMSEAEKKRILAIAGNPKNGLIEPLNSIPNAFRILQRSYHYDPKIKRTAGNKKAIGVVIDDKYLTAAEYRAIYTRHGRLREVKPRAECGGAKEEALKEKAAGSAAAPKIIYDRLLGAVPLLYEMAVKSGILDDLRDVYGNDLARKIISLAIHWIQDRESSAERYARFADSYALPYPDTLTESGIARLYSSLGLDKESLRAVFAGRMRRVNSEELLCYDSESIPARARDNFSEAISLKTRDSVIPETHLAILLDKTTGMPIQYRLFKGKDSDSSAADDVVSEVRKLAKDKRLTFVFGSRDESMVNLFMCSQSNSTALMAATSLPELVQVIAESQQDLGDFWDESSVIPGTDVCGRSRKVSVSYRGSGFDIWVHVFRSSSRSSIERAAFYGKLDCFELLWKRADGKERQKLSMSPLMECYKLTPPDRDLERNEDAVNACTRNYGSFAIVSTSGMTAEEVYAEYHERDVTEQLFQSGKIKVKPGVPDSHYQDIMEGRFLVAFTAQTILAELKNELGKERVFDDKRKKPMKPNTFSVSDVIDITSGVVIAYDESARKYWISGQSEELARLCIASGLSSDFYAGKPGYLESPDDLRREH